MKKIITLACAALLTAPAFAQFTTGGMTTSKSSSSFGSGSEVSDYNEIGVSYTMLKFTDAGDDEYMEDGLNTNGFSVKYIHGFSVSKSLPMFVETGLNFHFGFHSEEDEDTDDIMYKSQFASLAIPVNFAYRFNISESFAIKPFIGLNFKLNVLGRSHISLSSDFKDDLKDYGWSNSDIKEVEEWSSYYSKKDMGDKDFTWNRFQLGWHIGVDFEFNKFFVGINYGTDFIPAFKYHKDKVDAKLNSQTLNIGVGVLF